MSRAYLLDKHPELFEEINKVKTLALYIDIDLDKITERSSRELVWTCENGHDYTKPVRKRTQYGRGCPRCKSLKFLDPVLFEELNLEKTSKLLPDIALEEIALQSNKDVAWICRNGHDYYLSPARRFRGHGCPFCRSLAHVRPDLIGEWSPKNEMSPWDVPSQTALKYLWICLQGHEYQSSPNKRVGAGQGCPFCAGQKVLQGFNDIATTHSHLMDEWDFERNTRNPWEVPAGSSYRAWWICSAGHGYATFVSNRTWKLGGCKKCSRTKVSGLEKRLARILDSTNNIDVIGTSYLSSSRYSVSGRRMEADLVVRDVLSGTVLFIEIDGRYWHEHRTEWDLEKTRAFLASDECSGVVRIRTDGLAHLAIDSPNLLQLDYKWSGKDDIGLYEVATRIKEFIRTLEHRDGKGPVHVYTVGRD